MMAQKKQFQTMQHPNDIELGLHSDSTLYAGFASPLEDGGIFVATYRPHRVGERLRIRVTIPGVETPYEAKVEIRWVRATSSDVEALPGFGATFLELDPIAREAIARYAEKRAPIFYTE